MPADRSTPSREGKRATGWANTGMPTVRGSPRLTPWEEVNPALAWFETQPLIASERGWREPFSARDGGYQ